MKRRSLALLGLTAAFALTGCISLSPKPPERLMVLTAADALAPGTAITTGDAKAVAIGRLTAIPALSTQRVLVTDGPTAVAYLKGGLWAAQPAELFRGLVSETISARTGRAVTDPRMLQIQPNTRLAGQLSAFGLDTQASAVIVTFDATLAQEGSDQMRTRRFSASVPVASEQPPAVAAALNQAANKVAADVADWIGR